MKSSELVQEYKEIERTIKKLKRQADQHHELYGYGGTGARQHYYLMKKYENRIERLEYIQRLIKDEVRKLDIKALEQQQMKDKEEFRGIFPQSRF